MLRLNRPIVALLTLLLSMVSGGALAEEDTFLYTVQPGDSAWTITARYLRDQSHWQPLRQSNRLRGDQLRPGQVLRIPIPWLRVTTQEARLSTLQGEVMLNSGSGWTSATADTVLAPGTWLRTPPDGTATLLMQDGTRVLVRPSSELRLMALDRAQLDAWLASGAAQPRPPPAATPVRIELLRGGLENVVQPQAGQNRFEVHTPSAVTTVRGTEFRISANETGSRAEVLQGAIGFHNPQGRVELPVAMGSRAVRDTPPMAAVALLQAPEVGAIPDRLSPEQARTHRTPPIAGATAYRTQWFSGETPARLLHETVSDTPVLAFPDRPDGAYRLRLRAIDALGLEGLSAEHALQVETPPPPPWLKMRRQGQRLELTWGPAGPDASAQVQIALDAAFTTVVLDEPTPHRTLTLPLPPSGPAPGHARIRVLHAEGTHGPWSEPQRIDPPALQGSQP